MDCSDKTQAIVLKTTRYGDNSLIVKLLTRKNGLQSFMIKGAFNKTAKIRAALFQPLTLLNIVSANSKGELGYLKEATVEYAYHDIPYNINKNAITLFLCELLSKAIQETEQDIDLFDFVHKSLTHLDESSGNNADFPLKFAVVLSHYLGFAPNLSDFEPGFVFDLEEGLFRHDSASSAYYIDNQRSIVFYNLCNSNIFDDKSLGISNNERRQLLEHVITYYKLHISGFNEIKSADVLKTVLS